MNEFQQYSLGLPIRVSRHSNELEISRRAADRSQLLQAVRQGRLLRKARRLLRLAYADQDSYTTAV